jgi:gluconolactonase
LSAATASSARAGSTRPLSLTIVADGLGFPEGPVVMPDGSVVVTEIQAGRITRIEPGGNKHVLAQVGGGPNGAALGADGWIYVANNGGFNWNVTEKGGTRKFSPASGAPASYAGGWIERVHPDTGRVERLYESCNGHRFVGPNDLVMDGAGGFWFTDMGKTRERDTDLGGLYYANCDGSSVREAVYPLLSPNGCGLSPDGKTVYVAESKTARLWAFPLSSQGTLATDARGRPAAGRMLYASNPLTHYDSMGLEAGGNVCVASILASGITVVSPAGALVEFCPVRDEVFVTNIAFGGAEMRTAWITLSRNGLLGRCEWPRPGLKLHDGSASGR